MIFSSSPFSALPFSATDIDASVASPFSGLISNQDAPRAYLLRATPYDPVTGTEVEVRASIGISRPILDGKHWPAILKTAADTQVDLTGDEVDTPGRTAFGNIEVLLGGGDHDALTSYFWDGRDVEVLMGGPDFSFTEFQRVVFGTADDITFNNRKLSIVFRSRADLLGVPVQQTLYAGTGGLEGGADIKGREKPRVYGTLQNMTPVLVDRTNQIYQFHDGAAQAVSAAYDGGAALTFGADVADITASAPAAGSYNTQLSGGYIRLGAEPTKALTADVQGDSTGGYVSTAADIIQRIVENQTVLTSSDLDLASFAQVNLDNSAAVGVLLTGETAAQAITDLIQSIGGAWTFTREGLLTIAVFKLTTSAGTITARDIVKDSISRVRTASPTWRRRLGYAKSWTVQPQDAVVASATDARKDFISQEYRFSLSEDTTIQTRRAGAESVERTTLLANQADADTEVARQQGLFGDDLERFDLKAKRQQFKYRVGQTVTIDAGRFGFPRDMIIIGLRENTSTRNTEFRLIGPPPAVTTASALLKEDGGYLLKEDGGKILLEA